MSRCIQILLAFVVAFGVLSPDGTSFAEWMQARGSAVSTGSASHHPHFEAALATAETTPAFESSPDGDWDDFTAVGLPVSVFAGTPPALLALQRADTTPHQQALRTVCFIGRGRGPPATSV